MSRRAASFGGRPFGASRSGGRRRFLHLRTVTPATARRYAGALAAFARWARRSGVRAVTAAALDDALVEYVHDLFEDGRGRSAATAAVHGLAWQRPDVRLRLPLAAAALRGWARMQAPQQRLGR